MEPKKFDYQHYLLLAVLFVTTVGPSIVQFASGNNLPTIAKDVSGAVAFLTGILSLLKQFNPSYTAFKFSVRPPAKTEN